MFAVFKRENMREWKAKKTDLLVDSAISLCFCKTNRHSYHKRGKSCNIQTNYANLEHGI